MDLHRLRCAVAIADHGSFTEASVHLGLSQPTLSHAIARLEEELGARLFDRTPSGTRPTAAGERMLAPARRALREADNVRAVVDEITGVLTGELRLAGIRTAVAELAELAAAFHTAHDRVRVVLRDPEGDQDVALAIRDGVADAGLMRAGAAPDDFDVVPIGAQQVVVVFPHGTAPRRAQVTLDDLAGVPLVAPLTGSRVRQAFDAIVSGLRVPPTIVAECSNPAGTLELTRQGVGASLASSKAVGMPFAEGLDVRPVQGLATPLAIVTSRWPSPAALTFREIARTQAEG